MIMIMMIITNIRFLLIKCINGEKATYNTGVFSAKRERTFQVRYSHSHDDDDDCADEHHHDDDDDGDDDDDDDDDDDTVGAA